MRKARCKNCNYEWFPYITNPKRCPNCMYRLFAFPDMIEFTEVEMEITRDMRAKTVKGKPIIQEKLTINIDEQKPTTPIKPVTPIKQVPPINIGEEKKEPIKKIKKEEVFLFD